jgi:copper chaperone
MYQFDISDMTCGHCAGAITKAVKEVDAQAQVEVSLSGKRVQVRSRLSQQQIAEAIRDAGYTPR